MTTPAHARPTRSCYRFGHLDAFLCSLPAITLVFSIWALMPCGGF